MLWRGGCESNAGSLFVHDLSDDAADDLLFAAADIDFRDETRNQVRTIATRMVFLFVSDT